MDLGERAAEVKFVIRHGDATTAAFDAVFPSIGIRVITTPVRAPRVTEFTERLLGTARCDCATIS